MSNLLLKDYAAPLSAKDRFIKDGSKFDKLFPAPAFKVTKLIADGNVDDTIAMMKRIINNYSYQVRDLANTLKAKKSDGSLDVKQSVKNVFDFVFDYIKYNLEDGEQLQTPAHTWQFAQVQARWDQAINNQQKTNSADCDCMSIFCGSLFRELGIPFALRITSYKNDKGETKGWQHVYCIAYDKKTGEQIICDPVTNDFDYEKEYYQEKTYPMSLNGTDIYMLSGFDENTKKYYEKADGSLGLLSGKKERKEKKRKRKEGRKERKAAKKEIKAAKKSGDKEALKRAKEKKRAANDKINENRSKFTKGLYQFTMKTSLFVPRKMFLLLVRLNFRGIAKRLANEQAYNKFQRVWKKLGGGKKQLKKAIEKGKKRKALFGQKKLSGLSLKEELYNLGETLGAYGIFNGINLGNLGEPVTVAVGTALASAAPIIKKVMDVMNDLGIKVPGTAQEAEEAGEEAEETDEDKSISYDSDDVEEEEFEGFYYADRDELGTLGLFKKDTKTNKVTKLKKSKKTKATDNSKKKSSKKTKNTSNKKQNKNIKKQTKASNKQAKKQTKAAQKETKKQTKASNKQAKKQTKAAQKEEKAKLKATKKQAKDFDDTYENDFVADSFDTENVPTLKTKAKDFANNLKTKAEDFMQTESGQQLIEYGKDKLVTTIANKLPQNTVYEDPAQTQIQTQIQTQNENMEKESFVKKHKGLVIGLGITLLAAGALLVFRKQIFGSGKKEDENKNLSGLNPIKKIDIN